MTVKDLISMVYASNVAIGCNNEIYAIDVCEIKEYPNIYNARVSHIESCNCQYSDFVVICIDDSYTDTLEELHETTEVVERL